MKINLKQLGVPNKNGVIYSEEAMHDAINRFGNKDLLGIIGVSREPNINLADVACVVKNIRIENDYVVGDCTILKTPQGLVLEELTNDFEYRLAGTGMVDDVGKVSDYDIICVNVIDKDLVA